MAGIIVLAVLMLMQHPLDRPLTGLTTGVARVLVALINAVGMDAARQSTIIASPGGFAFDISHRCTGLLPIIFLIVSILLSRGSVRQKLIGIACSIPLVIAINFVRLLYLFYIGVHVPAAFHLMHSVVWQGLMVVVTFSLWLGWIRWVWFSGGSNRCGINQVGS